MSQLVVMVDGKEKMRLEGEEYLIAVAVLCPEDEDSDQLRTRVAGGCRLGLLSTLALAAIRGITTYVVKHWPQKATEMEEERWTTAS